MQGTLQGLCERGNKWERNTSTQDETTNISKWTDLTCMTMSMRGRGSTPWATKMGRVRLQPEPVRQHQTQRGSAQDVACRLPYHLILWIWGLGVRIEDWGFLWCYFAPQTAVLLLCCTQCLKRSSLRKVSLSGHSDGVWQHFLIPFLFRQWKRQSGGQKVASHRVNLSSVINCTEAAKTFQQLLVLYQHRLKWRINEVAKKLRTKLDSKYTKVGKPFLDVKPIEWKPE